MKIMRGWFLSLTCVMVCGLALVGCSPATTDADIEDSQVALSEVRELHERRDRNQLIDARPASEYLASHIEGSINMQPSDVVSNATNQERTRDPRLEGFRVLVVFGNDPASAPARALAKRLISLGYSNVKYFAGGFREWKGANLPTVSGSAPQSAPSAISTSPAPTQAR